MSAMVAPIGDERTMPWFWITTAASTLIRRQVGAGDDDPGLSQVIAVYTALVEIANEERARTEVGDDSLGFTAARKKLEVYSGASLSTVKRAIAFLERVGLVRVERRPVAGGRNLPNRYVLTGGGGQGERGGGQEKLQSGVQGGPELLQEVPTTKKPPSSPPAGDDDGDQAAKVHRCYVETFGKKGKGAELREDERKIIRDALAAGAVEELETCIRCCAASDFHQKRSKHATRKGGKYNSLGKIFKPRPRNGETQRSRIEWWLERASESGPRLVHVNAEADRIAAAQGIA